MSRKKFIAGNWKMNCNLKDSDLFVSSLQNSIENKTKIIDVAVFPPFTLLSHLIKSFKNISIHIGGQDCHDKASGAYTGNISAAMLKDIGCSHVLLGHSERRAYHLESNSLIKDKLTSAISVGLTGILCIGETLEEKNSSQTLKVIENQITNSLADNSDHINTIIAYEPVWAIGTSLTPSVEEIEHVHGYIRKIIASARGEKISNNMRILYGGSLNPGNAKVILAAKDVDGGLIGGASLKADDFLKIINSI